MAFWRTNAAKRARAKVVAQAIVDAVDALDAHGTDLARELDSGSEWTIINAVRELRDHVVPHRRPGLFSRRRVVELEQQLGQPGLRAEHERPSAHFPV